MERTNSDSYHSFLKALKGKDVTIYRGGPESKTGKLLDVKSDYITLYAQNNNNNNNNNKNSNNQGNSDSQSSDQNNNNNNNTVVYYNVQHVKSISEDTKSNSMQMMSSDDEDDIEYVSAENFMGVMRHLQNQSVQLNQGGPESKYGTLVGLSGDFIVLYTEDDGIVYTNVHHVKSVSRYNDNNNSDENENAANEDSVQIPDFIRQGNFQDVFKNFSHQWVSINRGGPEAMEGVLVENAGGHYTLVSNQEVLRVHPYHIKSISGGPKGYLKQNNNNNNSNNSNNNSQENTENTSQESESSSKQESSSHQQSRQTSSSSRQTSSRQQYSRRNNRERVVKTIDYVWKSRKR